MKHPTLQFCVWLALFAFACRVCADIVTLKSGEKIEGKILNETATEITIEFKVSASISDQRTVPKSDIASVEKPKPDEVLYQTLKNLKPGPNSFRPDAYDTIVAQLKAFTETY